MWQENPAHRWALHQLSPQRGEERRRPSSRYPEYHAEPLPVPHDERCGLLRRRRHRPSCARQGQTTHDECRFEHGLLSIHLMDVVQPRCHVSGILDISTMDDAVLRPAEATAGGAPTDEPGFPAASDFSTETVEGDPDAAADPSAEVSPEP